jgi:hypothetical protein
LQLNLPVVPVTDLTVKDNDLVISTQGRSFWILDDISPLQQLTTEVAASKVHLFKPRETYPPSGRGERETLPSNLGQNPPSGVIVYYSVAETSAQPVSLEFEDANGAAIASFGSDAKPKDDDGVAVTAGSGLNRFVWNMRYPDGRGIDGGTHFLGGTLTGPRVIPGSYKVKLTAGGQTFTQDFEIKKDPRLATTDAEYAKQFQLSLAVRDKVSDLDDAVNRILKQLESASQSAKADKAVQDAAKNLTEELTAVRQNLIEPRFTGFDDQTLIFPLQLNNRLASLQTYLQGDHGPTDQDTAVFEQLSSDLTHALASLKQIFETDLPPFNSRLKSRGLPAVEAN